MKTLLKLSALAGLLALTGCYYDPYYARADGYYGDAYYGNSAYYGDNYGYYGGGYYGGYYGPGYYYPWYPSFGLGLYYSDHHHGGDWHGHGGDWHGGHGHG